jgi:N-formylmaleamate deformylase
MINNLVSSDVIANGVKLHYYRTGGAKPALVMVHGITDDGLCWMPVAEILSQKFDLIMVDLRAHGKSEAPDQGYTIEDLAIDLAHLIRGLELEKPIILGHSLGAITSLVLAGLYPDLPRAVILEDPPPLWFQDDSHHANVDFLSDMAEWIISNKRKTKDDLLAEVQSDNPAWSPAELDPWADSKHRYSLKVVELIYPRASASIDFSSLLPRVKCPVLLISADTSLGAITGEDAIAKLNESVPSLQVIQITGAGHNISRDQFVPYIETVEKFISRLFVSAD